jgi:hypothetical protein
VVVLIIFRGNAPYRVLSRGLGKLKAFAEIVAKCRLRFLYFHKLRLRPFIADAVVAEGNLRMISAAGALVALQILLDIYIPYFGGARFFTEVVSALRDIFSEGYYERASTSGTPYLFLSELRNFARYFSSTVVSVTQLPILVAGSPCIHIALVINCTSECLLFTQLYILKADIFYIYFLG